MVLKNPHSNSRPIAFAPCSSPPLRLALLFPTLSIKTHSAGEKILCGVTGVRGCLQVSCKSGESKQFNLCTQQIKRTACTNQKLAKVLDSSEPHSVLNIYAGASCSMTNTRLLSFCRVTACALGFLLSTSMPSHDPDLQQSTQAPYLS